MSVSRRVCLRALVIEAFAFCQFLWRVSVSRFALHAGLVTFRQTFVLRCLRGKFLLPGAQGCPPFYEKERFLRTRAASSSSPTAGALRCLLKASVVGPDASEPDLPLIACRFPTRSRIARGEVGYNREKVLLVESGYNLHHQRAPFSRSGAVPEVIELPEHVAR